MAIDFPNSPTLNQIFTVGSRSWKWDGIIWAIYSNNPVLYRQDSPPSSPQEGDQWFETDTGRMFVYYGTAWVELGNATDIAGALQPGQITALTAVTSLTSDDVFAVVDNPAGAVATNKITYGNLVTNMSASLAPGLVLIKTQTVGSGVSSVAVSSVFSSTYDTYLIIDNGGTSSVDAPYRLTFGTANTGYYSVLIYQSFLAAVGASALIDPQNNATFLNYVGGSAGSRNGYIEIQNPFSSLPTDVRARVRYGTVYGTLVGQHAVNQSHTGFTLTASSGTMTGGTIRVYGYRTL